MKLVKQMPQLFTRRAVLPVLALTLAILLVAAPAFATTFTFIQQVSGYGTTAGQLYNPLDVAFRSSDGRVYVADGQNSRVQYFSATGTYLGGWGSTGSGPGQFNRPSGIAVNQSNGNVYVADAGGLRVSYFSADGTYLGEWGSGGSSDSQFSTLWGIDIDQSTGNVYTVDFSANRVQYFSSTGTFLGKWGVNGSADGQFSMAQSIAINQTTGRVYVAEQNGTERVQYFSRTGDYIGSWSDPARASGSYGIAVHPTTGDVYLAATYDNKILQYDATGTYLGTFGSGGTGPGQFSLTTGLEINAFNSQIYVTDYSNSRIQVFSTDPVVPPTPEPVAAVSVPAASWWSLGLLALAGGAVVALRRRSGQRA